MLIPLEAAEPIDLRADICVIGSGPTGQAVARTLAGGAIDVLLVEAGDLGPTRWGRRFSSTCTPSVGRQYPDAGHHVMIRVGGTSDRWAVHLDPDQPAGETVGLRLCRLDEVDLAARPHLGVDPWPIDLSDLEPHYSAAESLFGITAVGTDGSCRTTDQDGVSTKLFWAAPSDPVLGGDIAGVRTVYRCPIRSLVADRRGKILRAVAVDRTGAAIEVHADVFVLALGTVQTTRLLLDSPWTEAPSVANSSGLVGRYLSDHPQLIIGQLTVEPGADLDRILALAPSTESGPLGPVVRWPNLVTSPHRAATSPVARLAASLLAAGPLPRTQGLRNRIPRPYGGRTGAIDAASVLHDSLLDRSFAWSGLRQIPRLLAGLDEVAIEAYRSTGHRPRCRPEEPHWAHLAADGSLRAFQIFAVAEQLPNPDNRIELTDRTNQIGAHRPRITWRWSNEDIRYAERAADDLRHALASYGIGRVLSRKGRASMLKVSSHHAAGTTRMSASPTEGVVDRDLRAHDHPNLYVAGSSVFNASGFANPTLTDVALGIRLGRHLLDGTSPGQAGRCNAVRPPLGDDAVETVRNAGRGR
jgi:choline dehydrogenase-like flavoprotein